MLSNVEPFLECADWAYLNAVLKYLIFTDSECGVFDTSEAGAPNSHFPNLDCHSADISASFCAGILTLNAVNKLSEVSGESSDTGCPHSHKSIVWPFDFLAHKAPLFQQITADE